MIEIERKFLVDECLFFNSKEYNTSKILIYPIYQSYITSFIRLRRICIDKIEYILTIKAPFGFKRIEFEKKISKKLYLKLIKYSKKFLLKMRYKVGMFYVDNINDLWIAEIELKHVNEEFYKPEWLKEEVTGKKEFYNYYLAEKEDDFLSW